MDKKKTIDEVFSMCESRYALVNLVAARAREITDEALKHPASTAPVKPVNVVLDNLMTGRSVIASATAGATIYSDDEFELSVSAPADDMAERFDADDEE